MQKKINDVFSHNSWSGRATKWERKGRLMLALLLYVRTKIEGENKDSWNSAGSFFYTLNTTEFRMGKMLTTLLSQPVIAPCTAPLPFNIIWSDWDLIGLAAVKLTPLQNHRRFLFHLGGGFQSHLNDFPYHKDALTDSSRASFVLVKTSPWPVSQLHPRLFRRSSGKISGKRRCYKKK